MKKIQSFTNLIISCAIISLLLSCGNATQGGLNAQSVNQIKTEKIESIDGTYSFKDNSAELTITINGNNWYGKTIMVSGFREVL
jgi:hypothetical protein